jgi:hypothetical protein
MRKGARELDKSLEIERMYDADREAMKAALRVVLGLPKVLRSRVRAEAPEDERAKGRDL